MRKRAKRSGAKRSSPLRRIELPSDLIDREPPPHQCEWIERFQHDIQAFQDRWDIADVVQYVAADFSLVAATLRFITQHVPRPSGIENRFLEWGCGFGVITLIAADQGFDAVGIETKEVLLDAGARTRDELSLLSPMGQYVAGNFLPAGAEALADYPTHPSLHHPVGDAYAKAGLDVDDFGIIYSYPWPGENAFHRRVFETHAATGSVHVQFVGPNDVQAWQKTGDGWI